MSVSLLSILWAALRRRPFSFLITVCLCPLSASLVGLSAPITLAAWLLCSCLALGVWLMIEPVALARLGLRTPSPGERDRLFEALRRSPACVLIADVDTPWIGSGLRTIVVSRALLDIVDDQPLVGLVAHAGAHMRTASLAREALVWAGNTPVLAAALLSGTVCQLGKVLALAVGDALVVPLLVWPNGFVTWAGRLIGWTVVGLLGGVFLSGGLAGLGLGLLLGPPLVTGLRALLRWESRQAEAEAEREVCEEGLGPQLVEALETLAWVKPADPSGWHTVLVRAGTQLTTRIDRLTQSLASQ